MYGDTDGIVFRQVKILNGRRMILLFTRKYGKISAGTSVSERGKNKSTLAIQPFTYGRYELRTSRENYFLNGGEVIRSHFAICADMEKYLAACYAIELTEKLLPEEAPAPELFQDLLDFLAAMEERQKKYDTLLLAYQAKALQFSGSAPQLNRCVLCGATEELAVFSVKEGGAICRSCKSNNNTKETLIYDAGFAIVDILKFMTEQPFERIKGLALQEDAEKELRALLDRWIRYHLDIGELKSAAAFSGGE